MNRIDRLFSEKRKNILSIYMTAGYPSLEDTAPIILNLQANGADMIEVGMPFSDPLADGPVIQESSQKALENGMNTTVLFRQLEGIRAKVTVPLILMGYLNPVLQFGMEKYLSECSRIGIDGLIIPDLPLEEFESYYKDVFEKHGIHLSMLISPYTSEERIRKIASLSKGFLYVVSDASTTGAKGMINTQQLAYFKRIQNMKLDFPRLIGFGISNRDAFQTACGHANGAIIGSAFIKALGAGEDIQDRIRVFMSGILA